MRDTSFWNNRNQGLVITENALYVIPDNDNSDSFFTLGWSEFSKVEYQENMFYFLNGYGDSICQLYYGYFFKDDPGEGIKRRFAKHLTSCAELIESTADICLKAIEENDYTTAIVLADKMISSGLNIAEAYYFKGFSILSLCSGDDSDLETAKQCFLDALELSIDKEYLSLIHYYLGNIETVLKNGSDLVARNYFTIVR